MNLALQEFGIYIDEDKGGETKFTAYVEWKYDTYGSCVEEIDVLAPSRKHAKEVVLAVMEKDYVDGGKIIKLQERIPGMIYF